MQQRRHIHVACAIIERDRLVLAAQRSEIMSLPLKWEFPGGKLEQGELPEECLHRELQEELGVAVRILRSLPASTHDYPDFSISLYPFLCQLSSGEIRLHEHRAIAWLAPENIYDVDWAEADLPLIDYYLQNCT